MDTVRSSDGTEIAYQRVGDGPALIYVGGALNDRNAGVPLAKLLAGELTVYNYDRRGRGESGNIEPYSADKEIDDLHAVIEAAGGQAAVYGMSSGGVLALRAAARGVPISKLIMYEPPISRADERAADDEYGRKLTAALSAGRPGDAVELFLARVGIPSGMISVIRRSPSWEVLEALAPTLRYDGAVLDLDGGIPVAEVPTLVLSGGASPAWFQHAADRVAGRQPRGEHRTLPHQTHDVAAGALAPVLAEFILGGAVDSGGTRST
jgi:pimeloyl-ACP methyl ester carboxylesterase